jgi:hypothetical protein
MFIDNKTVFLLKNGKMLKRKFKKPQGFFKSYLKSALYKKKSIHSFFRFKISYHVTNFQRKLKVNRIENILSTTFFIVRNCEGLHVVSNVKVYTKFGLKLFSLKNFIDLVGRIFQNVIF